MIAELTNKFDDLDRAMQIAAKCRFKASRRLRTHKQIAQVTIALLSLELVIVPTLMLGGLKTVFSAEMTAAIQICAAAFVLVYSLLIGGGEFSLKEHRHHQCGLEINRILRELKPFKGIQDNDTEYQRLREEYDTCLDKYENHDEKDYREVILENFRKTDPNNERIRRLWWRLLVDNVLEYWHYIITWMLMLAWGCALFLRIPR
jgi:hypothetical protein